MKRFTEHSSTSDRLEQLLNAVAPAQKKVLEHPMYGALSSLDDIRLFMSRHVFAVWDFMSLLKSLQRTLTCVEVPWVPVGDAQVRRLINEIVLEEESDEIAPGVYGSHYEMYRTAMTTCGASAANMDRLLAVLSSGGSLAEALETPGLPSEVVAFTGTTERLLSSNKPHAIAAAFAVSREGTIPGMFRAIVSRLSARFPEELSLLMDYLDRHIQLDDEHHGPMAMNMLTLLCGDSAQRWEEATAAAVDALEARRILWDGVYADLVKQARC